MIKTDGLRRVNTVENNNKGMVTSNAVYDALENKMNYFPISDLSGCNNAPDGFFCDNNVANTPNNYTGYVFVLTLTL